MQPIMHGGLGYKSKRIRHVRADQSNDGVIGRVGGFSPFPGSRDHTDSSNPTTSTDENRGRTGSCKTPVFCQPGATRNTTHFGVYDTKCNAAFRHAPSCMETTVSQSNWPEMRKTLGQPGFLSGEDRIRTCGRVLPLHRFSKPALSTTQPPLRHDG